MGDVVVLLEVAAQREEQERPAGGGELHRRGEAAVADREVAGRELPVEPVHVAERLDAVAGGARRVDARAADEDHPQPRERRRASGKAAAARSSRWSPAAEPPAATTQTFSSTP